ncbi:hypothetical protein RO03_10235 [Fusobacterium nucleatum subsp. nucleatum]|uniref:Uncharacterized protein n=1 Tax=Fusobacterium nucleatum subsp. nucleatum TaxID=76856 RepID=A0A117MVZ8_FUSNC|nr:hypothetical protein [Fusobacterium nucleatum]ALF23558.1 hypothetical protein RO05_03930 [Fusobacterium nucleatum subsp. nucleatum ChDC F316]ASG27069.1 hypothetical protein RN84_09965 [Fusobacterium nucleatum subsp. nucleatum]KUL97791.1 hypothetical protein RO03_10235 [Fusobacterium nucleatum subsp. nucleatum]
MYYHLIMEDGLKYKDLSIEELEKIIDEKKLSYNNSRVYSSERKLNEVYENNKEELTEEGKDISFENVKIEKLISIAERKNDLQNSSYKFFLDIKNSMEKINWKNFLSKTYIIWAMVIMYSIKLLLIHNYLFTGEMEYKDFELIEKFLNNSIFLIILLVWRKDKYYKKEYVVACILPNVLINIINFIIFKYIDATLTIIVITDILRAILIQLVYNYTRERSYRDYKELDTINIPMNKKLF